MLSASNPASLNAFSSTAGTSPHKPPFCLLMLSTLMSSAFASGLHATLLMSPLSIFSLQPRESCDYPPSIKWHFRVTRQSSPPFSLSCACLRAVPTLSLQPEAQRDLSAQRTVTLHWLQEGRNHAVCMTLQQVISPKYHILELSRVTCIGKSLR